MTAIVLSAIYLAFIFVNLANTWWISVPFLVLELFGVLQLTLFVQQTWPGKVELGDIDPSFESDPIPIVVTCTFHSAEELERTLVGCRSVRNKARTVVVMRPDSPALVEVAERFDCDIAEASGNHVDAFWAAASYLPDRFVAWLEAGQVPFPDFLESASAPFVDGQTAVVQAHVGQINTGSFAHLRSGRDEDAFRNNVLFPNMSLKGLTPWFGGASVVRTRAIESIGGVHSNDQASLARALVRLQSAGWKSRFVQDVTVRSAAPNTLGEYLMVRRRSVIESLRVFRTVQNPLRAEGLSLATRTSHLALVSPYVNSIRHAGLAMLLAASIVSGSLPLDVSLTAWFGVWGMMLAANLAVRLVGSAGTVRIGDRLRQSWRTLAADLSGLAAVLGRSGRRGSRFYQRKDGGFDAIESLRPVSVLMVVLDFAILVRGATLVWSGLLPAFSRGEKLVALGLGIIVVLSMVDVLQLAATKRQRRHTPRLRTELQGRVAGTLGTVVDLSPNGMGIRIPGHIDLEADQDCAFDVRLNRADGQCLVFGTANIRSVVDLGDETRIGLQFHALDPDARIELIEYCAVHHDQDETEVEFSKMAVSHRFPKASRVLSGTAVVLGVVTMLFGPTAAPAFAADGDATVCLTTSTGSPIEGNSIAWRTPGVSGSSNWQTVGSTGSDGCVMGTIPTSVELKVRHEGIRYVSPAVNPNPSYTISTKPVRTKFQTSTGSPLVGGEVTYEGTDGLRYPAGTTDSSGTAVAELLPFTSLDMVLDYEGRRSAVQTSTSTSQELTFETASVGVKIEKLDGTPIEGSLVEHQTDELYAFGTTDASGIATGEILPGSARFLGYYLGHRRAITQNVSEGSLVTFVTKLVTIRLEDENGAGIAGGQVGYQRFSDAGVPFIVPIGATDKSGEVSLEMLGSMTSFQMLYDGIDGRGGHDTFHNPLVVFSSRDVTFSAVDSDGDPLTGVKIEHGKDFWRNLGSTDKSGRIVVELIPGHALARATFNGSSEETFDLRLFSDTSYKFDTSLVLLRLISSSGKPISGISVGVQGSASKIGTTDSNGEITFEAFDSEINLVSELKGEQLEYTVDASKEQKFEIDVEKLLNEAIKPAPTTTTTTSTTTTTTTVPESTTTTPPTTSTTRASTSSSSSTTTTVASTTTESTTTTAVGTETEEVVVPVNALVELNPDEPGTAIRWSSDDEIAADVLDVTVARQRVPAPADESSDVIAVGVELTNASTEVLPAGSVVEIEVTGNDNLLPVDPPGWECRSESVTLTCTSTAAMAPGANVEIARQPVAVDPPVLAYRPSSKRFDIALAAGAALLLVSIMPASFWMIDRRRRKTDQSQG